MSSEDLMMPRFKVVTDWPGRRDFTVGEIVTLNKDFSPQYKKYEVEDCGGVRTYITSFFEMFPLQFKRLEWWQERSESEMPEYVKHGENGKPRKIIEFHRHFGGVVFEGGRRRTLNNEWMPCTEQEFINFKTHGGKEK